MRTNIFLLLTTLGMFLASCQEHIEPAPETAGVNFYNASEAISAAGLRQSVYLDDTTSFRNTLGWFYQYTEAPYGQSFNDEGTKNQKYRVPAWLSVNTGEHRFMFAAGSSFLFDTAFALSGQSLMSFYLSEGPESDHAYRVTTIPEEWSRTTVDPAKVKLRVVNLSPDVGDLSCYRSDNNAEVLQSIRNGQASSHAWLDTTGYAHNRDQIVLQFSSDQDPENILMKTAVPNIPGAYFVVVLQGFKTTTARVVQTGVNPDGTPRYTTKTIEADLRVNLRRIY